MSAFATAAAAVAAAVDAIVVAMAVGAAGSAAAAGAVGAADFDVVVDEQPLVGFQAVPLRGGFDTPRSRDSPNSPLAPFAIALRHDPEGSHRPTVVLGAPHHDQSHHEPPLASRESGCGGSDTPSPVGGQQERSGCQWSDDFRKGFVAGAVYAAGAAEQVHNAPVLKAPEHKAQPQG